MSEPKLKLKLPQKSVAFSIVALLMVVTFATAVTVIDSEASYDKENLIEYDETKLFLQSRSVNATGEGNQWNQSLNVFYPSENGGYYLVDNRVINPKTFHLMFAHDNDPGTPILTGDVRQVRVYVDYAVDFVQWIMFTRDGGPTYQHKFVQESPGVWVLDLSAAQALKYRGANLSSEQLMISGGLPVDGIVEFKMEFYGTPIPVYYATVLALVFGCVLLVCALFATPWLSIPQIQQGYKNFGNSMKERSQRRKEHKRKKEEAKLWKY